MAQFMNREIRRRMHGDEGEEEEDSFNSDWDSANVAYAIIVSIGAGLATGLGGALVFFPSFFKKIPQNKVLGVSLALSAGVMLYVSFIEIFAKSFDAISNVADITEGGAAAITTTCFFFGMLICVGLEILVHWLSARYGVDHSHTCPAHGLPSQGGHKHGNKGANGCDDDNCARETLTPPPSPPPSPAAEGGEGWRDKQVPVNSVAVDVARPGPPSPHTHPPTRPPTIARPSTPPQTPHFTSPPPTSPRLTAFLPPPPAPPQTAMGRSGRSMRPRRSGSRPWAR